MQQLLRRLGNITSITLLYKPNYRLCLWLDLVHI